MNNFTPTNVTDKLIELVNANNSSSSWYANECLLTKNHSLYDKSKCEGDQESRLALKESINANFTGELKQSTAEK